MIPATEPKSGNQYGGRKVADAEMAVAISQSQRQPEIEISTEPRTRRH